MSKSKKKKNITPTGRSKSDRLYGANDSVGICASMYNNTADSSVLSSLNDAYNKCLVSLNEMLSSNPSLKTWTLF